jgi:hypothetical protein
VHFSSLLFYSELAVTNSNDEKHCICKQPDDGRYSTCITLLPFQIWCVREIMFFLFISFSFVATNVTLGTMVLALISQKKRENFLRIFIVICANCDVTL